MAIAEQPTTPPAERRSAPRRQPTLGTVCHLTSTSGDEIGLGLVWNISASGVSMLLPHRLQPGTTVGAELETAGAGYALPLTLRIAHVAQLRTGDYFVGGQFLRPLAPEEMRPFLA
jgi:hypothetical protein